MPETPENPFNEIAESAELDPIEERGRFFDLLLQLDALAHKKFSSIHHSCETISVVVEGAEYAAVHIGLLESYITVSRFETELYNGEYEALSCDSDGYEGSYLKGRMGYSGDIESETVELSLAETFALMSEYVEGTITAINEGRTELNVRKTFSDTE